MAHLLDIVSLWTNIENAINSETHNVRNVLHLLLNVCVLVWVNTPIWCWAVLKTCTTRAWSVSSSGISATQTNCFSSYIFAIMYLETKDLRTYVCMNFFWVRNPSPKGVKYFWICIHRNDIKICIIK